MPEHMQLQINGKRWRLVEVDGRELKNKLGECDAPDIKNKQIRIRRNLPERQRLEILIHEQLHAGLWNIDEETISTVAADIERNLTKMGYKRCGGT